MRLVEFVFPIVKKDGDATLGAVGGVVTIIFDDQARHGWDGAGGVVFALKAMIFCFFNPGVDLVIKEALLLLLIYSYPSFSTRILLVCCRREGGRAVELDIDGRYKIGVGLSL